MENIYSPEEFENLSGTQLQQKAQEIKQRFDLRRNFYHIKRNTFNEVQQWSEFNNQLNEFDKTDFTTWNNQWNNIYRSNNIASLTTFFNQGIDIFKNFEENTDSLKPIKIHSEEIETLKSEILKRVDEDMITIKNESIEEIKKGIQDLLNLKSELGLQKNFADNLKIVRKSANNTKYFFLFGFIISLLMISGFLIYSYNLEFIQNLDTYEKILVRLGAVATLGILSYFLFQQFKLHQILNLKYTHLDNFLGGGATYINQLVSQDSELKKVTNQKLTEMFMDIEDTVGNAKKIEHLSEKYTKTLTDTVEIVLTKVNELAKTVNEIKNPLK